MDREEFTTFRKRYEIDSKERKESDKVLKKIFAHKSITKLERDLNPKGYKNKQIRASTNLLKL